MRTERYFDSNAVGDIIKRIGFLKLTLKICKIPEVLPLHKK